ncbi:LodA/GoxA family CTQ-dependent oxidase [Flavobacterium sp. GCM10027622]|uniref:LodA/GoxA family CTQ-dependent oxidase n=1 Tax=unclassified Flavobacterium TaxID=196869 RepID=UPI003615F4FF
MECWNDRNSSERLKEMFVDIVQQNRINLGQSPAMRPVFLKPHGVAHGYFEMVHDLPNEMKVGVFALNKLEAWVRFSSDTTPSSADLKTTCGVGIKLFDVKGEKLLGDGDTQDFILQNYDVFFVDNAKEMADFTSAGVIDKDYDAYLAKHPKTKRILDEMAQVVGSTLTTNYWSVLPYAFGDNKYVKYKLEPVDQPEAVPFNDPDYLAIDLENRLRQRAASFRFMVQFRTNPEKMPLDEATVRWEESESEPIHIATLHLPQQDICANGQPEYGENLSFNPWHCLREHQPQGSISDARKVVYQASAEKRHDANGIPTQEPQCPYHFKKNSVEPKVVDDCIVTAAIYPPIGVCRVGNSKEGYFIGPEVTDPLPELPGFYRDETGAIKRQAARFRIYGLNAKGEPVRELTAEEAKIKWNVHLANHKAAWYQFQLALDIPEAKMAPPTLLRNSTVTDRKRLIVDPGEHTISGINSQSKALNGHFMDIEVYLGELKTDEKGRLIVLGGHGKSGSYDGSKAVTFANNEGWYDDTSDGPVTAEVEFKGELLKVQPAWVIVAPPNYAPMQKSVRTMWDLMRDTSIQANTLPCPPMPSFTNDILPIFERMTRLQWVNAGFASAFGFGGPFNFTTSEWVQKLNNPNPAYRELRKNLANQFRVFERDSWSPVPFPWLYGDAMNIPPAPTPRQHAALTDTQLKFLQQWAAGDFIADFDENYQPPRSIDDVPPSKQPDMLTKAAMEFCLADAFHPGCEMTWPMRTASMYMAPFRLKHATKGWIEPGYGPLLNSDVLTLPRGPLSGGQLPGGVTRWMAIPWQTDTASCRSGYDTTYDPYVPTFWPARVPNQVMSEEQYNTVINSNNELGLRLQAFANRANWLEPLGLDKGYTYQINHMIHHFDEMGIVEVRKGVTDNPNFPAIMEVENKKVQKEVKLLAKTLHLEEKEEEAGDIYDLSLIEKVKRFR